MRSILSSDLSCSRYIYRHIESTPTQLYSLCCSRLSVLLECFRSDMPQVCSTSDDLDLQLCLHATSVAMGMDVYMYRAQYSAARTTSLSSAIL